jgi:hypothetical protein
MRRHTCWRLTTRTAGVYLKLLDGDFYGEFSRWRQCARESLGIGLTASGKDWETVAGYDDERHDGRGKKFHLNHTR